MIPLLSFLSLNVCLLIGIVLIGTLVFSLCLRKRYTAKYLISGWFCAALVIVFGTGFVVNAEKAEKERLRSDLQKVARIYRDAVVGYGHADIPLENATEHENYGKIVDCFKRFHRSIPSIPSTYTLRNDAEGHLIMFVEPDLYIGRDKNGENQYKDLMNFGDPFPAMQKEADKVFVTRQPYISPKPYTDEYGTWITALEPIPAPDGKIEGILGIDYFADHWNASIAEAGRLPMEIGIAVFALMLAGVVFFAERQSQRRKEKAYTLRLKIMFLEREDDTVAARVSGKRLCAPPNAVLVLVKRDEKPYTNGSYSALFPGCKHLRYNEPLEHLRDCYSPYLENAEELVNIVKSVRKTQKPSTGLIHTRTGKTLSVTGRYQLWEKEVGKAEVWIFCDVTEQV